MKKSKAVLTKIAVCGIQQKNIQVKDGQTITTENFEFTFFDIDDPNYRLDDFDGAIIPSGAFEQIGTHNDWMGGSVFKVKFSQPALLKRERELSNLAKKNNWACFLVDEVIDELIDSSYRRQDISQIDLCKKTLNSLGVRRASIDGGSSILKCKSDAFKKFFEKYGAAHTAFVPFDSDMKILATSENNENVGLAALNKLFFLPYQFTTNAAKELPEMIELVANSIIEYRAKNQITIPAWLDEFKFSEEEILTARMAELNSQLSGAERDLTVLKERKSILTASGEPLVAQVNKILKNFFNLRAESVEKFIEDVKILDSTTNATIAAVEIKGVNSGVKREHVNQVDSHRERLALNSDTAGLLIINDNAKVDGIEKRLAINIDKDQVRHAKNMNVVILRTIDLLLWMQSLEAVDIKDRKQKFLDAISKGGGWLKFEDEDIILN